MRGRRQAGQKRVRLTSTDIHCWASKAVLLGFLGGFFIGCGDKSGTTGVTDTAAATDSSDAKGQPSDAATDAVLTVPGLGKVCAAKTDCPGTLFCLETNSVSGTGICSQTCINHADCGKGYFCNPVADKTVCTPPRYCDPCTTAQDCGADLPLCLPGSDGRSYCTHSCAVGDTSCSPGSSCKTYGSKINESACMPDFGSCSGDGSQCSPCSAQADCASNAQCLTSPDTGEQFCAQTCKPGDPSGCPAGYGCWEQKTTPGKGLCYKSIAGKLVATCAKGDKGFCDSCAHDWECASNRCASKDSKSFCVQPNPCDKTTEAKDCPYGGEATFCVPSSVGNICSPPPAYGCQGFKGCMGHACGNGEVCDNGVCKKS